MTKKYDPNNCWKHKKIKRMQSYYHNNKSSFLYSFLYFSNAVCYKITWNGQNYYL